MTIVNIVIEKYHIYSILDGLTEEYNPFVMQMYGTMESLSV